MNFVIDLEPSNEHGLLSNEMAIKPQDAQEAQQMAGMSANNVGESYNMHQMNNQYNFQKSNNNNLNTGAMAFYEGPGYNHSSHNNVGSHHSHASRTQSPQNNINPQQLQYQQHQQQQQQLQLQQQQQQQQQMYGQQQPSPIQIHAMPIQQIMSSQGNTQSHTSTIPNRFVLLLLFCLFVFSFCLKKLCVIFIV